MSTPKFKLPASVVVPDAIHDLIARGALFAVNHSGGKDSQAMYEVVKAIVPQSQIMVVHSDLGDEVEWDAVADHISKTIDPTTPFEICSNPNKSLIDMVLHRGQFPSPSNRQCTSDLKRGPIETAIRRYLKNNTRFGGLVVNCMGMRAQESPNRAKLTAFKLHPGNSIAGREWYDWLPIQAMHVKEVWSTIAASGHAPHPAYRKGMTRLSCRFCIMASDEDLKTAARHSPWTFAVYTALENKTGRTMMMPRKGVPMTLEQITGQTADPILVGKAVAYLEARQALATLPERESLFDDVMAELAETGELKPHKAEQLGMAL